MKRIFCVFLLLASVVVLAPAAFADCLLAVASKTAPTDGTVVGPGFVSVDTTNTPANMAFGATNQAASELLIYDNGGAPNCFAVGKTFTISYTAPLTSPVLDLSKITIFDSQNGTGLQLSASATVTPGSQISFINITVTRAGVPGNPLTGVAGSGLLLHNLSFDVSALAGGSFLTASVSTNPATAGIPGPVVSNIGKIVTAGPITISPASLTFNSQIVGTASPVQQVSLGNGGISPIIINSIVASPSFAQTNTCGGSIAVGGVCTLSVTFTPTDLGAFGGTITINDNATGTPHTVTMSGTGVGSPGTPAISSISPNVVYAGGPAFTLAVTGTNFAQGSQVMWNGSPRVTTAIGNTILNATIPASDLLVSGSANVTVVNPGSTSNSVAVSIQNSPAPALPIITAIPHIVQGAGYVTKITILNLSTIQNSVILNFLSQSGALVSSSNYAIPPFGTVRVTTPLSARSGPSVTQWALVGSTNPIAVNSFLEYADSNGKILNSVGFNSSAPLTDFSAPVEFEPAQPGSPVNRTVGIALANTSDTSNSISLSLQDNTGNALGSYSLTLAPFSQTAFDLSLLPQIANGLPKADVVGTVAVRASQPVAAVALLDELGQFAATPVFAGRSNASVDQFTSICPTAQDVIGINRDVALSFEGDPTSGTLVCRAAEGSANLTLLQTKVYTALRVLKNVQYDAPLPFTNKSLYSWLTSSVTAMRFRSDIATSFCCDSPGSIDIAVSATSPYLQTSGWLGSYFASANQGLDTLGATLVQLARASQGFPNTCGANDNTINEMGQWAAVLDFYDYNALHSGSLFDDTNANEPLSRYRSISAQDSLGLVSNGKFCAAPLAQVQPTGTIDFGTIGLGDGSPRRGFAITAGTVTQTSYGATTLTGNNPGDFSITSDTCAGNFQPPSCSVVVSYNPTVIGASSATLNLGTAPPTTINLSGAAVAPAQAPLGNYTYVVPHITTGAGFGTKLTVSSLVSITNDFVIRYISQTGAVLSTSAYTMQPNGTTRISLPDPSARFGASVTQWAIVTSRYPVNVNLFFELADTSGHVLNAIGFNAAPALQSFVFPVEFEPGPGFFNRTVGLALSNPNNFQSNYTMTLLDSNGATLTTVQGSLAAYAQTAIDLSTLTAITSVLPKGNFVGSIRVITGTGLSAVALGDDFGMFSATPPVSAAQ